MRRHLQQVRGQLVTDRLIRLVVGWLLAIAATTVYLLTLEPSVSFWDCGEFIAVSYLLQVGHPPGAPLYQLLAHAFTWLAGGDPMLVARCCNALSAVAGGLTVMFLYWSILLTFPQNENKNPAPATPPILNNRQPDTGQFSILNFQFPTSPPSSAPSATSFATPPGSPPSKARSTPSPSSSPPSSSGPRCGGTTSPTAAGSS